MNKNSLINFISKYNVNGLCPAVKIGSKGGSLYTKFNTEEKSILGMVQYKNLNLPDADFGVFNTAGLLKLLSAFQSEINVELEENFDKFTALKFSDDNFNARFMLAGLDIIPESKTPANIPDPDLSIPINSVFIDRFNRAKSALPESTRAAIVQDNSIVKLVINYADHQTDIIELELTDSFTGDIETLTFNVDYIRDVFAANKDCTEGSLDVCNAGLMILTFKGEDFSSKYYLPKLQD